MRDMSETKAAKHNQTCNQDKHNEHLCYLQYEGYHFGHRADYKALVQDAQFICRNCGRTAKRDGNLCDPVAL